MTILEYHTLDDWKPLEREMRAAFPGIPSVTTKKFKVPPTIAIASPIEFLILRRLR